MLAMVFSAFTGINIDGYMGVLVALFIFRSGFMTCKDSVSPLLGSKPDKEFVQDIVDTATSFPEIIGIHDLLIHDYGVGNTVISFHAEVPCEMDFMAAHELIDDLEDSMKENITAQCLYIWIRWQIMTSKLSKLKDSNRRCEVYRPMP